MKLFFQLLAEYQILKTNLKIQYEQHKLRCRIEYMEKEKELSLLKQQFTL